MNIQKAKEQIKNAITAYFTTDEMGNYVVPIQKQRPVFLMGPPGIGKTAIMEQIAEELGVGLLSYSMTHHTRQSALGLPFISHKKYGDVECDVSEYTMSEIISAMYEMMETSDVEEGILFLDEINCVSETLAPVMLQFLQFKIFGRHRIPDGWIVVTAGNPPEYNNSVREFDIVTWDRLKRIDVEPDFDTWKEYAYKKGVHPVVLTYLEIKKGDFYQVESTVNGKEFVTARGWDDLSTMIQLYEANGLEVDEDLIAQYIQKPKIAKEFAVYYDLFMKYRSDYQIDQIMAGEAGDDIIARAQAAKFDERLSLLGLILDGILGELRVALDREQLQQMVLSSMKSIRTSLAGSGVTAVEALEREIDKIGLRMRSGKTSGSVSTEEQRLMAKAQMILSDMIPMVAGEADNTAAFKILHGEYGKLNEELKEVAKAAGIKLSNVFKFAEAAFGEGQELLILVTELTISYHGALFISHYGCEEYFKHNKELLFYERQQEIIDKLEDLDL